MSGQRGWSVIYPLLLFIVAGCSSPRDEELHAWMKKVRSDAPPAIASVSEPSVLQPITCHAADQVDPFSQIKITEAASATSINGALPDPQRAREPLESYPLDSLRMVGSLQRRGQAVALVQADKVLYQVRRGDHLGQDQGKVIDISESAIDIQEVVQETTGTWTTRKVQLSIHGGQ